VAWQKYLATLLGSDSEATATVLAIFLGGLAAGYALLGGLTRRVVAAARQRGEGARLLGVYGLVEGGIGLYALLFPFVFTGAQLVSYAVPAGHEAASFAFDVLLTVLLLAPPTILMGGTIPILTQGLSQSVEESTRVHAWVYAFNTAGAFGGALAGGFLLIPLLGLDGSMRAMGLVNLTAGAIFLLLQWQTGHTALTPEPAGDAQGAAGARFGSLMVVAILSGFAMMSLQTVLNRIGALAFGASQFTFSMVVAVFVLGIALGSFAVSALSRIAPLLIAITQWALVALLALLYFPMQDAPYYAHVVRVFFRNMPQAFYPFWGAAFGFMLLVLVLPIGLSGALLPLLFHQLRREIGDLGGVAGRLYSWNTVGSLLGALLGGYALLFWLDLHHVYAIAVGALAVGAGILSVRVGGLPRLPCAAATLAVLVGLFFLPAWSPGHLAAGTFRNRSPLPPTFLGPSKFFAIRERGLRYVFYDDDPVQSAAVVQMPRPGRHASRSIVNNGKSDGNLESDYTTTAMVGLLPALFTDDPSNAFVIGWGTGTTAGELAHIQDVEHVRVAEISPGVIKAAPLFDYGNMNASHDPKVRILRQDAYRALLQSKGRFGIIASEPSNPWVTGVEMLYSEEFLKAAKGHLTPGGVYAQWFHLYEIDEPTVEIAMRTYAAVFDHVAIWFTKWTDVVLLGFNAPASDRDLARLHERFERADFRAGFERAGIPGFEELLAHEVIPIDRIRPDRLPGPIHTLRHPILSYHAARAFFVGLQARLRQFASEDDEARGAPGSLLAAYLGGTRDPVPEADLARITEQTCGMSRPNECATLFARWHHDYPHSSRWAKEVVEQRARLERESNSMSKELIADLAALYDGAIPPSLADEAPLQRAVKTTQLFASYIHPAFPFPATSVSRAWAQCNSGGVAPVTCETERMAVEAQLGLEETSVRSADANAPPGS
jgi:spermidine synthase